MKTAKGQVRTAKGSVQRKAESPKLWNGMYPRTTPLFAGNAPSLVSSIQEQQKDSVQQRTTKAKTNEERYAI